MNKDQMTKKYEFVPNDTKVLPDGRVLTRIRAIVDIPAFRVYAGDLGGYLEKESNLSHYRNCWVSDNACVYGNAQVYNNARVFGDACIYGGAEVYGNARVGGNARLYSDAWVYGDASVFDNAKVYGDARVYGDASVYGRAKVYGNASVFDNACVYGRAHVFSNVQVYGNAYVSGNARVSGSAKLIGHAQVSGDMKISCELTSFLCYNTCIDSKKEIEMNTTKDMLVAAARAINLEGMWDETANCFVPSTGNLFWNPLFMGEDSLSLANALQLNIQIGRLDGCVVVTCNNDESIYVCEPYAPGEGSNTACRWAIVEAAAQIGKTMV